MYNILSTTTAFFAKWEESFHQDNHCDKKLIKADTPSVAATRGVCSKHTDDCGMVDGNNYKFAVFQRYYELQPFIKSIRASIPLLFLTLSRVNDFRGRTSIENENRFHLYHGTFSSSKFK